ADHHHTSRAAARQALSRVDLMIQDLRMANDDLTSRWRILLKCWEADWHQDWNWSFGDPSVVEARVRGGLEVDAHYGLLCGIGAHAQGTFTVEGLVLSQSFPVSDALADVGGDGNGTQVQFYAGVFGNDISPPINQSGPGTSNFLQQHYPWDIK